MTVVTVPLVDAALGARLELAEVALNSAWAEAQSRLYPAAGTATLAVGGGLAVYAGPGSPLNRAVAVGLTRAATAAEIESLAAFYHHRGARVVVEVCPLACPSLWLHLGELGCRLERFLNVYYRSLPAEPPAELPPGVTATVAGAEHARLWTEVVSAGFAGGPTTAADGGIAGCTYHSAGVTCFLAWVGQEPVGGGALGVAGDLACLFSASTRSGWRGRGVQVALLWARLAYAAGHGCTLARVQALPGSVSGRNAERVGFRLAYTKAVLAGTAPGG